MAATTQPAAPTTDSSTSIKSEATSGKKRSWKQLDNARKGGERKKQRTKGKNERRYVNRADLHKGKNVILCTCQKWKEERCGRDLQLQFSEFIKQYLEEKGLKGSNEKVEEKSVKTEDDDAESVKKEDDSKQSDEAADVKPESVAAAIAREVAEIKSGDNALCRWYQGTASVVIEILEPAVKASELLIWIFESAHPQRPALSCWAYRLLPGDCTSFSDQPQLIEMAGKVIAGYDWSTIPDDHPYAIDYTNRGNKKLDRDAIYKGIAAFVDDKYKVNLRKPKTVLLLNTFHKNAAFSIIPDGLYEKHFKFNLSKFMD